MSAQIRTEVDGRVLVITVDNVAKKNAFVPEMMRDLTQALTDFDRNDEQWVAVLCAAGEHTTAGLDMPKFFGPGATPLETPADAVDPFALKRHTYKPVIAVVQGLTLTIGIEMMLAADIVVAADTARFCQMESKRGIAPLGGAHFRFLTRTGWGNAMYHLMLCDEFDAQRALQIGLVQEVVPYGKHIERGVELAQRIARNAPLGLRAMKEAALTYIAAGEAAAVAAIPTVRDRVMQSRDAAEGIRSFVERREARFEGAMSAPVLRVFSYLPNPRLAKATIAARLCGVEVEIRGATPRELAGWLWDFDARPLAEDEGSAGTARAARTGFGGTLHKTEAFLAAHPFGTVPAAFSPDGAVGIFESNSILRAVARLGAASAKLYGDDPYGASRIDSFLDASLVFARDVQVYLLKLGSGRIKSPTHERARNARDGYLGGLEQALLPDRRFLVGDGLTLADICFASELTLFSAERAHAKVLADAGLEPLWSDALRASFPRALSHFERLCAHPAFAPDLGPYLAKLAAR